MERVIIMTERLVSVNVRLSWDATPFSKMAHSSHQTLTQWSPGVSPSRLCSRSRSRSKVTRYWHSVNFTKIVIRYSFSDNAVMGSQTFWDKMHATAKQIAVLQQTFTQSFPGTAASRTWSSLRSRSNVTIYRHFCNFTNIYTGPTTTTKNGHS